MDWSVYFFSSAIWVDEIGFSFVFSSILFFIFFEGHWQAIHSYGAFIGDNCSCDIGDEAAWFRYGINFIRNGILCDFFRRISPAYIKNCEHYFSIIVTLLLVFIARLSAQSDSDIFRSGSRSTRNGLSHTTVQDCYWFWWSLGKRFSERDSKQIGFFAWKKYRLHFYNDYGRIWFYGRHLHYYIIN